LKEILDLDQQQTHPTSEAVQNTVPDRIMVALAGTGSNCQKWQGLAAASDLYVSTWSLA